MNAHKLLGFFIFVVVSAEPVKNVLEKNVFRFKPLVCRAEDCVTMANVISSAMNSTADPCDDFYEYACGDWAHTNETPPPDEPTWTRMAMFNKELWRNLRTILESNEEHEVPVQMAKRWYRSCMDEEALQSHGIQPLASLVIAVGGWPIAMALGQWNPSDYSWQEIERYYSRFAGSYALYDLAIGVNNEDPSLKELWLKHPTLPLQEFLQVRRTMFDPNDKEAYGKLIMAVAKAFAAFEGAKMSDEKIAREVDDMIKFEMTLDSFRNPGDILAGNISLVQLFFDDQLSDIETSRIDILTLVQNMFEGINEIEITEDESITLDVLYFIKLNRLLNETSLRTIVNYVHWYYISGLMYATDTEMRNLLLGFMTETAGIKKASPRWEQCVIQMKLKHALAYQFVSEYFNQGIHDSALEMVVKIQTELDKQINGSVWLDDRIKDAYRDKLWNVKTFIGYPEWYKNVTNVEEYYEGLTVNHDYFNNVLKYMQFEMRKNLQTLRLRDHDPEWLTDPITINAFYIIRANSLNIPAADFQPPLSNPMMPNAVRYGIIGSMLGHELSHGFDNAGFLFDKDGRPMNWPEATLQDTTRANYTSRAQCFIDQFDDFTNENATKEVFGGSRTVGENIADAMGLQSVFNAYKLSIRESIVGDRKLPGLGDLSNEQLFFLSFGTIWCEKSTPEFERKRLVYGDDHSTPRIRTLAAIANVEGFAEAFHCPEGSPMNPKKKCNIWKGQPVTSETNDDTEE
ncbi:membrane metallo-endopeptidase-like 1 isoform X2 [Venturia canescens]|uniref:membrane metallo-endopeptidase-like 1 isoform X2 n=1 Tax=Venturia canescens TaxID=32260 RepID=UPI001C9C7C63|nr:membrane metallo-endopeptidase-like 1 isoform X2 [Venturia canescens]